MTPRDHGAGATQVGRPIPAFPAAAPKPISAAKPKDETPMRSAQITRKTAETDISVEITLDGSGTYDNQTGVGFF